MRRIAANTMKKALAFSALFSFRFNFSYESVVVGGSPVVPPRFAVVKPKSFVATVPAGSHWHHCHEGAAARPSATTSSYADDVGATSRTFRRKRSGCSDGDGHGEEGMGIFLLNCVWMV